MKTLASVLLSVLLAAASAGAQQDVYFPPGQPQPEIVLSVSLVPAKVGINFKGDQGSFNANPILALFSVEYRPKQTNLTLRYDLLTGWSKSDSIVPAGPLFIGLSNFGQDPQQQGQQNNSSQKPIAISLSGAANHRIELAALNRGRLRPMICGEWSDVSACATGEVKGRQTTDSERLSRFVVAGGLAYAVQMPSLETDLVVAFGSDRYAYLEARALYQVSKTLWARFSYLHKNLMLGSDSTLRLNAAAIGVAWEF